MKVRLITIVLILFSVSLQAQTADEIINKYFENTGGKAKWEAVQGLKKAANISVQGMELPLTSIQLKDGRQISSFSVQGMTFYQEVFDGSTLWGSNQMTVQPEKSDAEATENFKTNLGLDFPSPFLNYAKKGYKAEFLGKETVVGIETFKIKLTKKPIKVDGVETENVSFYYFDTEKFLPVVVEAEVRSGPQKGAISQGVMSDYREVNGLKFPFSIAQGEKGQPAGVTITFTSVELDPKVDAAVFAFPGN